MTKKDKQQTLLLFAWLISLTALLATLYSSEMLNMPVCYLCWYQRICTYPLVIILGIAAYKNEAHIIPYVIAFPILNCVFAIYQYLEQMIPGFSPIAVCSPDVPCSTIHLKLLGFITYPFLSLLASLGILVLLYITHLIGRR